MSIKAAKATKSAAKGKSTAKGKKVPVKAKKELFGVLIRIPWDHHKIVMDYGETKKGYREVPTFNGSLKKIIPEFSRLQKANKQLQEDLAALRISAANEQQLLLKLRNIIRQVAGINSIADTGSGAINENNFAGAKDYSIPESSLPGISGAYGRAEAGRQLRGQTKSCPACGKMGLSIYAEKCTKCGESLDDSDID